MIVHNKIGFDAVGSKLTSSLRQWMEKLDEAGIPFFVRATDNTAVLTRAQTLITNSQVPHTLVYAAPEAAIDYSQPAKMAAHIHWQTQKAGLPQKLDPSYVWLELLDKPDPLLARADWLGEFACHLAQLTLADGYKLAAFSFGAGEPADGAWETDNMLSYLELCQEHPDQLGVALHEYSFATGQHLVHARSVDRPFPGSSQRL